MVMSNTPSKDARLPVQLQRAMAAEAEAAREARAKVETLFADDGDHHHEPSGHDEHDDYVDHGGRETRAKAA